MPAVKIPKKLRQVSLWIHPEGQVIGSLFLKGQTKRPGSVEEPLTVLNEPSPFLVMQREAPDELRFYNKASIVRVEYQEEKPLSRPGLKPLHCRLDMMDGALIEGSVWRELPPRYSRLYDYLNISSERFMKLHVEDDNVCLVNKAYIVCVTHLHERAYGKTRARPNFCDLGLCDTREPLCTGQE
jgi:hypothetical protein